MSADRRTQKRPSGFSARCASALLTLAAIVLPWGAARADEGGVPFWLSGTYSSLSAVPQQPGWYVPTQLFFYDGSAGGGKTFQIGGAPGPGGGSPGWRGVSSPAWGSA